MKKSVFTLSIFFLTIWFGQAQEIQLIKDFVSGNDGLDIIDHVVIADQLFFTVENDSTQQTNLWVTDGTLDGSVLLHDSLPLWNVAKGEMLSVFADKCYFPAFDNEHGYELWRTDGSLVGTELFVDIIDGPESSAPSGMEVLNSSLLIWASKKNGNDLERAIYRSDGITPTVELITAIDPCFFNNNKALNTKANIGGTIYFSYYLDYCLWKTDGTAQGTESEPYYSSSESIGRLVPTDSLAFWSGFELWRTNGTSSGSYGIGGPPYAKFLTPFGPFVLFTDNSNGDQLWISDGTEQGTKVVREFMGILPVTEPRYLTEFQGKIYMSTGERYTDPVTLQTMGAGRELWVTDGTIDGTQIVKDIYPGPESNSSSFPSELTVVGGYLYFFAKSPSGQWGIYRTDGTENGTVLVYLFQTGEFVPGSGSPHDFIDVNGKLFFTMDDGVLGNELYKLETLQPVANFDYNKSGLTVDFTNTSENSVSWQWDFGNQKTSTSENPVHTYDEPGFYEVCLISYSNLGSSDTLCQVIMVGNPPQPFFSFQTDEYEVIFTDNSTENPTSWNWDFGDSSTSDEQNPVHIYSDKGSYEVCLTVSNDLGSNTLCQTVEIIIGGIFEIENAINLEPYPNPFFTSTFIKIDSFDEINIYNACGRIVNIESSYSNGLLELKRNNLPAGVYFLQVIKGDALFGSGRILIMP